ncbi:MAG: CDP-alcohol phosphatidyltransferase family protein [Luteibaculaceae bacterium]
MNSYLVAIVVLSGISLLFNQELVSLALLAAAFILFLVQQRANWINLPFFGVANQVTLVRLFLVLTLCYFAEQTLLGAIHFQFLVACIPLLDVFDGLIARYRKEESHFGMYFDMEVDAAFVMVTSILIFKAFPSLWIVLIPAFLRYFYKFFIDFFDKESAFKESKQRFASVIAGNYFVAIVLIFFFQNTFSFAYLILSSLLILFSFGLSFFNFYKWRYGTK